MKKGFTIATTIIVIGLLWYFFIKPQDYQVRVLAKSFPGTINQSLKSWNNTLPNATIQQLNDLNHLEQKITFGDSTNIYNWEITPITDSTSKLKVDIKDVDHSFFNKLYVPFTDTDFEKRSRKTVTEFMESLNQHLKDIKITFEGIEELPSTYCACVEHTTIQSNKAFAMMKSYPFLNSVIINNEIQMNGIPFIETTEWNMQTDSISFNFCYPIIRTDSLPTIKDVVFKEFIGKKSLKATYNGNYMTSDRAWYSLLDYAKAENISVEQTPIEYFFNNPNMGGDALRWKAEIFLPIKETDE
ncbi:GyrI-like domain-containing protein [Maribacter confluentis]|uniref:GyrI-like domain-containing protein n=1 Tax=Maribacter confluentis TaxID=1656093 RepID=A0ABT8RPR7_9FLAO|nr:GyrI-like domain-containing protein [Maribacter confluentis]MDO1512472.1 GyrI-like domain-containing protein [Maribacter confluentis]